QQHAERDPDREVGGEPACPRQDRMHAGSVLDLDAAHHDQATDVEALAARRLRRPALVVTDQSSGTLISMPPQNANTSITAVVPGAIDACRRSISQPPRTAVTSPPAKSGALLRRAMPPMT